MLNHITDPDELRGIIAWGFSVIGVLIGLGFYSVRWFFLREFSKHEEIFRNIGVALNEFMAECHKCQVDMLKNFVSKDDYTQLMGMRTEAHKIINNRLSDLETGQARIADKLDTFHKDMQDKTNRLSKTFVFRDAVISMRLDNISDRIGVEKWTRKKEEELAKKLESEFDLNERKMNNL